MAMLHLVEVTRSKLGRAAQSAPVVLVRADPVEVTRSNKHTA